MEILKIGKSQLSYWDEGTGLPVVFIHGVATLGESSFTTDADTAPLQVRHVAGELTRRTLLLLSRH
jgi:hypothetical protein